MAETKKTTAVKSSETKAATTAKKTTKAAAPKAAATKTAAKPATKAAVKAEPVAEVKAEAPKTVTKAAPKAEKKANGPMLKVTLVKSPYGRLEKQIKTLKALGLNKTHSSNVVPDNKATRGMIFVVKHLVQVEEVK